MGLGYAQPPSYPTKDNSGRPLGELVNVREIADGYAGTVDILADMKRFALEAYPDERINILARQVTMGCPRHDHACEAATILQWFQTTYRYTRLPYNPRGLQRLQTPSYTLFDSPVKTGECASLSTAMAAMLMSLGCKVAYRTAGTNAMDPLDFEHVYLVVEIPGEGWIIADPSYEGPLGWEHPASAVKRDWVIE